MKKLVLFDGMAMVYRSYYALNGSGRMNSKGLNTSAVLGFTNTLYDLLKKLKPTHVAVAFDVPKPTFRHEMYTEYKANREAMPEAIQVGLPYIRSILQAFRIPVLTCEGFEADDIIGTTSHWADENGYDEVIMVTPDKDFGQLVTSRVHMYRFGRMGRPDEIMGVEEICNKFGVSSPAQVKDLLGLWGDSSDKLTLRIGADKARIGKQKVWLHHEAGLARAAAAHNDLKQITHVLPSIEAHAQVLGEDHVPGRVFVAVLLVQLPDAAPAGRAVFLAGPSVHAGRIVHGDCPGVDHKSAQHEFDGMRRPAKCKWLVHGVGKDSHELKEIHTVLIDACGQHSQIQHGQGKRRPHGGGVPERLLVYIGIPPKNLSHGETQLPCPVIMANRSFLLGYAVQFGQLLPGGGFFIPLRLIQASPALFGGSLLWSAGFRFFCGLFLLLHFR